MKSFVLVDKMFDLQTSDYHYLLTLDHFPTLVKGRVILGPQGRGGGVATALNGNKAAPQRIYCLFTLRWRFPRNTLLCRLRSEMREWPSHCGVSVGRSEELGGREAKMWRPRLQLDDVNLVLQRSRRASKPTSWCWTKDSWDDDKELKDDNAIYSSDVDYKPTRTLVASEFFTSYKCCNDWMIENCIGTKHKVMNWSVSNKLMLLNGNGNR